jgi:hypothetical protein
MNAVQIQIMPNLLPFWAQAAQQSIIPSVVEDGRSPYTTAGSSGLPDHFGARFSQPSAVTTTVSSWRIPNSPGM